MKVNFQNSRIKELTNLKSTAQDIKLITKNWLI